MVIGGQSNEPDGYSGGLPPLTFIIGLMNYAELFAEMWLNMMMIVLLVCSVSNNDIVWN